MAIIPVLVKRSMLSLKFLITNRVKAAYAHYTNLASPARANASHDICPRENGKVCVPAL